MYQSVGSTTCGVPASAMWNTPFARAGALPTPSIAISTPMALNPSAARRTHRTSVVTRVETGHLSARDLGHGGGMRMQILLQVGRDVKLPVGEDAEPSGLAV